jgi:hypothetical protein
VFPWVLFREGHEQLRALARIGRTETCARLLPFQEHCRKQLPQTRIAAALDGTRVT